MSREYGDTPNPPRKQAVSKLSEYRVTWQQCPSNYNPEHVIFVSAASAEDARIIAKDYVERKHGITWFVIDEIIEAIKMPVGKVFE